MCRYSIENVIKNGTAEAGEILNNLTMGKIFYQATLGLDYLHNLGFSHGKIHQRNVLVAEIIVSSKQLYIVKLSDFRFVKRLQTKASLMLVQSSNSEKEDSEQISTDVKSLGKLFSDVLKRASVKEEEKNVEDYRKLIKCMTSSKAYDRPSVSQILRYLEKNCSLNPFSHVTDQSNNQRPGLCVIFLQETFDPVRILIQNCNSKL